MAETNRAKIVDENFTRRVLDGNLPEPRLRLDPQQLGLDQEDVLDLFESQLSSRLLDLTARQMRSLNQGFYTIGSAGHEGNAVFGKVFRHTDMAFLHYRSGAFVIQRAKQVPGSTIYWDLLLSLSASSEDPIAGGRHKVWGSKELFIPPQTSTIASHLPKAVGAALSVPRAEYLNLPAAMPYDSVVVCNFGAASAHPSTALGAMNPARWCSHLGIALPLVLICEDNSVGISVQTPSQWIASAHAGSPDMRYFACDGRDVLDLYRCAVEVDRYVRVTRRPAFVHVKTVRLLGHAGSDVEAAYHSQRDILKAEADDPLFHTARLVLDQHYLNAREIVDWYEALRERMARVAERATHRPKLASAKQIIAAIVPPERSCAAPPLPSEAARAKAFTGLQNQLKRPQHMARLLNWALRDLMLQYPNMVVFGEDVAKKGGVYNVTVGLQRKFGTRRVFDTVLDEQSVLGAAIGMAHNGFLSVPEIQFLAYVHNAEDQIRGEAATLPFFSSGQFANPVVVRIASLAYQKGFGGHFHNDNSIAVFRDVPGIIIACPSTGADAARMLRRCVAAAYRQQRVAVFLEPIALYMTKDLHQSGDGGWQFDYPRPDELLDFDEIGVSGNGKELAIVSYGNGHYLSHQAAKILNEEHGVNAKVIDLRWLAPLPQEALLRETAGCGRVLIVDECRRTGSLSEALLALYLEHADPLPKLKRVTAEDCFIPLAEAANLVLPCRDDIVNAALELMAT